MHLRVFQASDVSSPRLLELTHRWLVPLTPETRFSSAALVPKDTVRVRFNEKNHLALYMLIHSVPGLPESARLAGHLDREDSINILNHIFDRLAYD